MKCSVAALASFVAISSSSAFVGNSLRAFAFNSKHPVNANANANVMNGIQSNIINSSLLSKSSNSMALSMSTAETETPDTDTDTAIDIGYDVVKVDLSDNRDYPIYIGDGFDDEEAGKMLRSHITGNRALLVTNDLLEPLYLDKYEQLLKNGGDIQIGEFKN